MRYILAAAAVGIAMSISAAEPEPDAEPDAFLMGEALAAEVREKCPAGCVVFNRADAVNLERAVGAMLAQAFQTGVARGSEMCRL